MKKIIAACLSLSVALMASTALAEQHHNMDVKLQPTGQTIDLKAQCENRDEVLKEKYNLSDDEIKKLNGFQIEEEKILQGEFFPKQEKNSYQFQLCFAQMRNYIKSLVKNLKDPNVTSTVQRNLQVQMYHAFSEQYDKCKKNIDTPPENFFSFVDKETSLTENIKLKLKQDPKLMIGAKDNFDFTPDISICNAIKAGIISNKDAIVPQLEPVFTHNPTEQQNN